MRANRNRHWSDGLRLASSHLRFVAHRGGAHSVPAQASGIKTVLRSKRVDWSVLYPAGELAIVDIVVEVALLPVRVAWINVHLHVSHNAGRQALGGTFPSNMQRHGDIARDAGKWHRI